MKRERADLVSRSGKILAQHLGRRPTENPVARFAARFARELPSLQEQGLAHYHAWAFATVRQLGSSAEVMARYLTWLAGDSSQFAPAIAAYDALSTNAKAFILKAARAVMNAKKPFAPSFDEWIADYDRAVTNLVQHAD